MRRLVLSAVCAGVMLAAFLYGWYHNSAVTVGLRESYHRNVLSPADSTQSKTPWWEINPDSLSP